MSSIVVTGAFGQIGTELTQALQARHGDQEVLATGHRLPAAASGTGVHGPSASLDVTDPNAIRGIIEQHRPHTIYHLAARLSAVSEKGPQDAWAVNMGGLYNILEAAREGGVRRVFWPSSIAVFGPSTPRDLTPQDTVMRPTTIYGVAKVSGELLCDYYAHRYGVDVRGVRYPGVISSAALPGGGTTDYAVEMFYAALDHKPYTCFVRQDTVLPMIYMPDCIQAALDLMDAPASRLKHRNSFNLAAMSFSAGELATEITTHEPEFICQFEPDERQAIADSWPRSIDDTVARTEWGWTPRFGLSEMTRDMLASLRSRRTDRPA